jgi:uncharacterized protein
MSTPFYGRERELRLLNELLEKRIASLVVIKGRRRIGKSRLAEEFGKSLKTIFLEGLPPKDDEVTAQSQRTHFAKSLEREIGTRGIKSDDWDDLFWHLAQAVKEGQILIVLDEINWMGSKDPTFLGKLKTAWDKFFKKNPKLILILSGSMSAWIEKNILSGTGFLGRVALDITLDELPLSECAHFWQPLEQTIAPTEKFKILSVTGGVPRYLEEIDPRVTADEMIYRLCFRPEGLLFHEFERIFSDLFSKRAGIYKKIVTRLAVGDADFQEICDAIGMEKGGVVSQYVKDLEETQYVQRYHSWNLKSKTRNKLCIYRLKDNYLRFYLKYIEPNSDAIEKRTLKRPPGWDSIMGLQFENLVLNNFHALYALLGIPYDEIVQGGPYFQNKTKLQRGCQIDYLIQLKYNSLYICEIKFCQKAIGVEIIEEVQEKMKRLHTSGGLFSMRPVLIHVNGVTPAVKESAFFTHVIDFGQLLKTKVI